MTDVTQILSQIELGDPSAAEELLPLVYEELRKLVDMGGTGGVISINRLGEISMVYNTPGMYRGSIDTSGRLLTAIYGDE